MRSSTTPDTPQRRSRAAVARLLVVALIAGVCTVVAGSLGSGGSAQAAPGAVAAPLQEVPPDTTPPDTVPPDTVPPDTVPPTEPPSTVPAPPPVTTPTPPAEPAPGAPPVSLPPDIPVVAPPIDPSLPPPPPGPPLPDPSPQVAAVLAQLHMTELHASLEMAQAKLGQVALIEAKAQAIVDAAAADRDGKRRTQADAAATAYVRGSVDPIDDAPPISIPDSAVSAESVRILAGSAIDHTHDEFVASETWWRIATAAQRLVQRKAADTRAALDAAQRNLDDANAAIFNAAGGVAVFADLSPTVLGAPTLTADEIAGWYTTKGIVGWAAGVDLRTMAGYYISEGQAEGVRGDIAFAQAMVETGAFTSPLTRHSNFAGIGACDSCATGFDFESPQFGVRAQMQLLHAYADKTLSITDLANPAVGANPDRLSVRGCCPTWNKLTGTWATDPNYGPKIMTVYVSMLQYATAQRTAALAVPAPAPQPAPASPAP